MRDIKMNIVIQQRNGLNESLRKLLLRIIKCITNDNYERFEQDYFLIQIYLNTIYTYVYAYISTYICRYLYMCVEAEKEHFTVHI